VGLRCLPGSRSYCDASPAPRQGMRLRSAAPSDHDGRRLTRRPCRPRAGKRRCELARLLQSSKLRRRVLALWKFLGAKMGDRHSTEAPPPSGTECPNPATGSDRGHQCRESDDVGKRHAHAGVRRDAQIAAFAADELSFSDRAPDRRTRKLSCLAAAPSCPEQESQSHGQREGGVGALRD